MCIVGRTRKEDDEMCFIQIGLCLILTPISIAILVLLGVLINLLRISSTTWASEELTWTPESEEP